MAKQISAIDRAKGSWDDYFDTLKKGGQGYVVDYIKNTQDLSKVTGDDLVKANQNARQAAIAHNASLKQQTLGAKAASAAMKGLALVGNVALSMLASFVVTKVVGWIDDLIHAEERAIEKADEAIEKIEEQQDALKSNKKTIDSISVDYVKLSKGVDSLGRNISLNSNEYERYNEIVNQIANMFPQMVQGYTDEGNAIIAHKGNVEELTKAYKEQKNAAQDAIIIGAADVFKGYKSKIDYNAENWIWEESGLMQMKEFAAKIIAAKNDKSEIQKVLNDYRGKYTSRDLLEKAGLDPGFLYWNVDSSDYYQKHMTAIEAAYRTINTEIDSYTSQVKPIMQAYLESSYDYQGLDEDVQDIVKQIVGQFNAEFYAQFDNETEMASWVTENIINKFKGKDGEKLAVEFSAMFDLQTQFNNSNIAVAEYQKQLSEFLKTISFLPEDVQKNIKIVFGITSPMDGFDTSKSDITYSDGQWWINRKDSNGKYGGSIGIGNKAGRASATVTYSDGQYWVNSYDDNGNYIGSDQLPNNSPKDTLLNNIRNKFGDKYSEYEDEIIQLDLGELEILSNLDISPEGIESWSEVKTLIANAGKEANKAVASIGDLEDASNKIKTLGSAFKELSDDGYITTKTLSEIKEATGLSEDEWEEYQTKLMRAKAGSAEFKQILSDLTYAIIENEFATIGLENATEEEVAAILRENGVLNANEVAQGIVNKAKAEAILKAHDFASASETDTEKLYEQLTALGLSETAIASLTSAYAEAQASMNKILADGVESRLGIMENELKSVKSIADAYALLGRGYDSNKDGTIDYVGSELHRLSPEAREDYLAAREQVLAYGKAQEEIQKILDEFDKNVRYSGSKSSSDKNEALDNYLKDVDNRIKDLEHQIELTKNLLGEDADVTQYYKEIQQIAHEAAERLRSMGYDDNSDEIQDLQNTWWNAQKEIKNYQYDHISNLIDQLEQHAKVQEHLAEQEKEYYDYLIEREQSILDIKKSQFDIENKLVSARREAEKALATSKIGSEYLDEETRKLVYNDDDYKLEMDKIDEISDYVNDLTEDYVSTINSLGEDEMYKAEEITAQYERRIALKEKELEIVQAEIDLQKKQTVLNNVLAEKNIRQIVDGKWVWTHDTDKLRQAAEDVADAEAELEQRKREQEQLQYTNNLEARIGQWQLEQEAIDKAMDHLQDTIDEFSLKLELLENPLEDFGSVVSELTAELASIKIGEYSSGVSYTGSSSSLGLSSSGRWGSVDPNANVGSVVQQMMNNSTLWHISDSNTREQLHKKNVDLGKSIGADYNPADGKYYQNGKPLYDSGGVLEGLGGIKATKEDEIVLPPNITSKILDPKKNILFEKFTDNLGTLFNLESMPIKQIPFNIPQSNLRLFDATTNRSTNVNYNMNGNVNITEAGDVDELLRALVNKIKSMPIPN